MVDDCSTDGSGKLCDELSKQDSRITVIHHKTNQGLSISRYDGYLISKGEYISFVDDDDDYIFPWFYEVLIRNIGDAKICCLGGSEISSDVFESEIVKKNASLYKADL